MSNTGLPVVFLVDDEPFILEAIGRCLSELHIHVMKFTDPELALAALDDQVPDVVISDQRMPKLMGTDMLTKMKSREPSIQCVLVSAHNDFSAVADAFNQRIIERYICKPWDDSELLFLVDKMLSSRSLLDSSPIFETESTFKKVASFHGMISANASMFSLFQRIEKASTANVPIFVTGETGTGKERVAVACHNESYRKSQPFVAVNCANFSENLMESQLFGHKKGAFTGAVANQQGFLAAAAEGTLFLDEVTTIPIALQAKLLRVIQEREFSPLGSQEVLPFKAQLLTASSTRLQDAVKAGDFREDLFYRLNVIVINLPPLRDRGTDVEHIAQHLLQVICAKEERTEQAFSNEALKVLKQYSWPGNVRQLENFIHSLVVLNNGSLINATMCRSGLEEFSCTDRELHGDTPAVATPTYEVLDVQRRVSPTHGEHFGNDENIVLQPADQSSGRVSASQEGSAMAEMPVKLSVIEPLWVIEKQAIERAIDHCQGNIPKAATYLEVSASTLYRKLQAWQAKGL